MQTFENTLSEEDFRRELINRFFHPNSYFYRCVKHELESLVKGDDRSSRREYQLCDTLIDKLVDADDKMPIFQSLEGIAGFDAFLHKINEGVKFLREAELDAEKMKIEIEGLARSLIKIAVKAIFVEETKAKVEQLLNPSSTQGGVEIEEPEQEEDSTIVLEEFGEIPMTLEEEITREQSSEKIESSLDEPEPAEPETIPDITFDSSDMTNEEKDFLLPDESKDALVEGGCEIGPTEEGDSIRFNEDSEPQYQLRGASEDPDPVSVTGGFVGGVRGHTDRLQKAIGALGRNANSREQWEECGRVFDGIAANAMVYGFEAFEEIAVRAQDFVDFVLGNFEPSCTPAVGLLSETNGVLAALLAANIDNVDRRVVEKLLRKLQNPRESLGNVKLESTLSLKQDEETFADIGDDIIEDLLPQGTDPEPVDESLSVSLTEEQNDFKISKFKLPGEDDEEIVSLVNEISMNTEDYEDIEDQQDSPSSKAQDETAAQSWEQPADGTDAFAEESPVEDEAFTAPTAGIPVPDEKLALFKEQSEFYFNIVDEALDKLQNEPNHKISLEDLELSCHSLYELSMKLDLEPISQYPYSIKELARKVIAKESALSDSAHKVINDGYQYFRNLSSVKDVETIEAQNLLTSMKRLASGTEAGNLDEESFQIL